MTGMSFSISTPLYWWRDSLGYSLDFASSFVVAVVGSAEGTV
jgi:hypothetical protein